MADTETKSGAEVEKDDYIGVQDCYKNAANDTDIPRYADDEERKLYEKFGKGPEPELTAFSKAAAEKAEKAEAEKDEAEKAEAEDKGEPERPAAAKAPAKPSAPAAQK